MSFALRRLLPPRLTALLGVAAVLCALGLEVHGATMGHPSGHGHAAGLDAATADLAHGMTGHHDPGTDDGLPPQTGGSGCCHTVACSAGVATIPASRAGEPLLVTAEAAASTDAGTLRGLRHSPPLRPPR